MSVYLGFMCGVSFGLCVSLLVNCMIFSFGLPRSLICRGWPLVLDRVTGLVGADVACSVCRVLGVDWLVRLLIGCMLNVVCFLM